MKNGNICDIPLNYRILAEYARSNLTGCCIDGAK